MTSKTVKEFIEEFRKGFNPITGEKNLYKDITDEMIWNAAIKSIKENDSSSFVYKCRQAFIDGYELGHNDTVKSCYGCSEELADDWIVEHFA
jgi:hypothetical protein